ncbi:interleukin-12 subunit alpha [Notolabrus celidotus]|uniref:interleukin-12 subunit alpha n=1 Tax=Notolabrus celidotus TaxID=1203425 RepID=UPI0014903132|nr:interleukin-12 subunit alpha [Notolabrus celidotus]XP_034557399.1 interleukin-12 subunit alpha [Notolabrus celidotus]
MAIFNICFSSCVLLMLTLFTRTSTGLPVRALSSVKCRECSVLFRDLLLNITELLNSDLRYGITSDEIVVKSKSDTAVACAPNLIQNPGCMMQRNSSFSESECLHNIIKDLAHYSAAIESYINSTHRRSDTEVQLLKPTLGMIQSLRKNCSLMPDEEEDSSEVEAAQLWGNSSFTNRQQMYKMMRGFYVRTITISRAMGYIASGDHRN